MRSSPLWRQHWRLVVAAGALAAGFLASAPVVALVFLAAGMTLLGVCRLHRLQADGSRRPRDGALGDFGYLEAGPSPVPDESSE
jgi:hypothetical protein